MVADDLIATSLVLGAGAAARVEGAVVVGVGVDAIVTDDARYLVGGPGWSGAGPAAVGMMSCPCLLMIRGVLSPTAAGRW